MSVTKLAPRSPRQDPQRGLFDDPKVIPFERIDDGIERCETCNMRPIHHKRGGPAASHAFKSNGVGE